MNETDLDDDDHGPHWADDMGIDDELIAAVQDPRTMLWYDSKRRRFDLTIMIQQRDGGPPFIENPLGSGEFFVGGGSRIIFSPWTGKMLPRELYDEHYDRVRIAIGQTDDDSPRIGERDFPPPYRDDRWWRQEGIPMGKISDDPDWKPEKIDDDDLIETYLYDPPSGYRRAKARSPHHCQGMMYAMLDVRYMIAYLPHIREYGIRVVEPFLDMDKQQLRIRPIRFCPWCGEKLPESLKAEWERRLAEKGLVADDPGWPTNLPPELCSDQWWRDAGL